MNGEQYVKQLFASWSSPDPRESYFETGQESVYYYPNMCHVCHCFGENSISLQRCGGCNLISYCGLEHQRKDWPQHRNFCKAVTAVKKDLKQDNIFTRLKASKDSNSTSAIVLEARDRVVFKAELMAMIAQVLKRQFKPHEIQMINHPRVCAVCFESNTEALINCEKCPQSSFCKEHLNDSSHKEICLKLLAAFTIEDEGKKMQDIMKNIKEVKIAHQKKPVNLPGSIKKFIETYVLESEIKEARTGQQSLNKIALISERFSRSLSLLFAIEKLKYTPSSTMVVHVIGATIEEIIISDWEIILHWLPQLTEFKLVLIGPNILLEDEQMFSVCKLCKKNKKSLVVEIETTLYEEYFKKPNFMKPDMIAAFNAGIYAYPSWDKAMKVVAVLQCPFVIMSYQRIEAYREQEKICSMFGSAKCIYFQPNPFASMMYFRNPADEGILSKNDFMLVYKYLHSNSEKETI